MNRSEEADTRRTDRITERTMNSPRILLRARGDQWRRTDELSPPTPGRWRSADELHPHERTSAWAPLRQSKAPVRVDCAMCESLRRCPHKGYLIGSGARGGSIAYSVLMQCKLARLGLFIFVTTDSNPTSGKLSERRYRDSARETASAASDAGINSLSTRFGNGTNPKPR